MAAPLLEIRNLSIRFPSGGRSAPPVVNGLSYRLRAGRSLAIVGESGAGKSLSCRALLGLLPRNAVVSGSIYFAGTDLQALSEAAIRPYRGSKIAMVFQDADDALNPTMRVGQQICEAIRLHTGLGRRASQHQAIELLRSLKMPAPQDRIHAYPHELSGGMKQRVMLAVALAGNPQLLIADESTRALDVTTQAQIVSLIRDAQRQRGMAVIMITHDLRLAGSFADDILVMCGGSALEYAPTAELFESPRTPYTKALLDAIPDIDSARRRAQGTASHEDFADRAAAPSSSAPIRVVDRSALPNAAGDGRGVSPMLDVVNVVQEFPLPGPAGSSRILSALSHVSLRVYERETVGVVGESGSGKTTLARAIVQLPPPIGGQVWFRGHELTGMRGRRLHLHRRGIQMVFQDPFGSLNPKWCVSDIVEEPLLGDTETSKEQRRLRVEEALALVGLPVGRFGQRRPGTLSGGQCQRVAIARAVVSRPALVVCDEAVSSLDVLTQDQILVLFRQLQQELSLSYLFISHDLLVVRQISDRVAVLHSGQLCEIGPTDALFDRPAHPFTRALFASISTRGRSPNSTVTHEPPSPSSDATGCRFRTRCAFGNGNSQCAAEEPPLTQVAPGHFVACHFPDVIQPRLWQRGRETSPAIPLPTNPVTRSTELR